MLTFRRNHGLLGTNLTRGVASLRVPGLRIYVVWMTGNQRFDTRKLGLSVPNDVIRDAGITIQLEGTLALDRDQQTTVLSKDHLMILRTETWRECWTGPFRALVFEWDKALGTVPDRLDLAHCPDALRNELTVFATDLEHGLLRGPVASLAAQRILDRMRAEGLPVPSIDLSALAPPLGLQRVADALSSVLCSLNTLPQLVDVADKLEITERQTRRVLRQFGDWLPSFACAAGWQHKLRLIRTTVAASFVTVPGVTIERVAASVGYRSGRAMLHSWNELGVPTPQTLRCG